MHVLIIKTSSLGDIIHTLPALTDAAKNIADISFDWVLEPAFSEIPRLHPKVKKIILSPLREWRKNIFSAIKQQAFQQLYHQLREEKYDFIIDAQGLMKSKLLTFFTRGIKCGYDKHSARESWGSFVYDQKFNILKNLHAITRIRHLFSQALGYAVPNTQHLPDYGISKNFSTGLKNKTPANPEKYMIFLHGTTRNDKRWPEDDWRKLAVLLEDKKIKIYLPWSNAAEKNAAEKIGLNLAHVQILPRLNLIQLAEFLAGSAVNIAVDTGLGHLSAALDKKTISLYGPTDVRLIGTAGNNQIHLSAPHKNLSEISAEKVYAALEKFNL